MADVKPEAVLVMETVKSELLIDGHREMTGRVVRSLHPVIAPLHTQTHISCFRTTIKLCLLAHEAVAGHTPRCIDDPLMTENWRTRRVFCRSSTSIKSTNDRVETVLINHTVQVKQSK